VKSTDRLQKKPYAHLYRTERWKKLAKAQVTDEPLCRMCLAEGVVKTAKVCDHIEPHRGDEVKFWSGPFQSLCWRHHLVKVNHEQYERRTGKKYQPKLGCDARGFPHADADHHWNK